MRDPTIAVPHTLSALGLRLPAAPLGPGQPTVVVVFMYSLPVARAEQHAAHRVRSWYRATRPPRAGSDSKVAVIAPSARCALSQQPPPTRTGWRRCCLP